MSEFIHLFDAHYGRSFSCIRYVIIDANDLSASVLNGLNNFRAEKKYDVIIIFIITLNLR